MSANLYAEPRRLREHAIPNSLPGSPLSVKYTRSKAVVDKWALNFRARRLRDLRQVVRAPDEIDPRPLLGIPFQRRVCCHRVYI
jgi:hypothetical protein